MTRTAEKSDNEKKYDEFRGYNEAWTEAVKWSKKLYSEPKEKGETDDSAAERRSKTRAKIINLVYKSIEDKIPEKEREAKLKELYEMPDSAVESYLAQYTKNTRDEALNYFVANGKDVVRGFPKDTLEYRVYNINPVETGEEGHDALVKKLGAVSKNNMALDKYAKGENIGDEVENVMKHNAAEKTARDAQAKSKAKGRCKLVQNLVYLASKLYAVATLSKKEIVEITGEKLKEDNKAVDADVESYGKARFASENLVAEADKLLDKYEDEKDEDDKALEELAEEEKEECRDKDKLTRRAGFLRDRNDARNEEVLKFMQYLHEVYNCNEY